MDPVVLAQQLDAMRALLTAMRAQLDAIGALFLADAADRPMDDPATRTDADDDADRRAADAEFFARNGRA